MGDVDSFDFRSIEDNILLTCADLVSNSVVVGHYRPGVVLFVESTKPVDTEDEITSLKTEILARTAAFNARLFIHERITDPLQIVVVKAGSLPRTKVRVRLFLFPRSNIRPRSFRRKGT